MADSVLSPQRLPCKCTPSMSSEFDYSGAVAIDKMTELDVEECIRPTHGMTGSRFEFAIEAGDNTFVHLSSMTLNCKLKVQAADGTDLKNLSHKPAFVNNIIASLWSSVVVKINDHEINPLTSHHPGYKAIISSLLSYNDDAARHLAPGGFSVEDGTKNATLDSNFAQYVSWKGKLEGSKVVSLSGALPLDICSMDNMLPPGTKLDITLEPSPEAFHLMCNATAAKFKTTFQDIYLQVRRVRMPPLFVDRVLSSARHNHHRYLGPYTHLSVHEAPSGSAMHVVPVYPAGHVMPKHIVVAQVPTANFRGTVTTNPYVFPHLDLSHLALRVDNVVATDSELTPDFANKLVAREYFRLFSQTGKRGSASEGTLITEENFLNNHSLFPFDLTPDECNSRHLHLSRTGKLDIEMRWKKPLTASVTVLVLATFDQVLSINPRTKMATSTLI